MSENKDEYNPKPAQNFAIAVYIGVVIAASTLFISFVLTAFPADAYLPRVIMTVAGLLIGASACAFPVALHTWTIEKNHHTWTTVFYYGEIAIMAVNTVVAFMSLLSKNTGYVLADWALLYEPFSVGAIVYTLVAWGTVFLLDPEHKRKQSKRQMKDNYENKVSEMKNNFLGSIEGQQAVASAAVKDIEDMLANDRNGAYHFGQPAAKPLEVTAAKPFEVKQYEADVIADLTAQVAELRKQANTLPKS